MSADSALYQRAARIKLLILDVDGVLTDGCLLFDDEGREYMAFNVKDTHGIAMLHHSGKVQVAVISGRESKLVRDRMAELGIELVHQGDWQKLPVYENLLGQFNLSAEQVAYVGDDLVDLPVMRRVGLAVCVKDAHHEVKKHAHWVTENPGGHGAVREVCEFLMQAQDCLDSIIQDYLR